MPWWVTVASLSLGFTSLEFGASLENVTGHPEVVRGSSFDFDICTEVLMAKLPRGDRNCFSEVV